MSKTNLSAYILKLNARSSEEFNANISARREFRSLFGVDMRVTKCMDGRINFTRIVQVPFGIIFPHRNIGGVHRVGWPFFRATLDEWEDYTYRERRQPVLFITYHFSAGDIHRGCAGFQYDKDASIKSMLELRKEINRCYEGRIHPVVMGIETDSEAIILHGDTDEIINNQLRLAEKIAFTEISKMFPNRPENVQKIIARLLEGNVNYILELQKSGREPQDLVHGEIVLALGQGFDWLKNDNLALIIGPCDPDLARPIITAAGIIKGNIVEGRVSGQPLLLVSTPFRHKRNKNSAMAQTDYLAEYAQKVIKENITDMPFDLLKGTVDLGTREFYPH